MTAHMDNIEYRDFSTGDQVAIEVRHPDFIGRTFTIEAFIVQIFKTGPVSSAVCRNNAGQYTMPIPVNLLTHLSEITDLMEMIELGRCCDG